MLAGDVHLSYRDLDEASDRLASALAARVSPGDRVALMMTNRPEFIVAVNAISKLGAASVLLSPAWKQREVDHALAITGARLRVRRRRRRCELLRNQLGEDDVIDLDGERYAAARASSGDTCHCQSLIRPTRRFSSSAPGRPGCRRQSVTRTRRWATGSSTGSRRLV